MYHSSRSLLSAAIYFMATSCGINGSNRDSTLQNTTSEIGNLNIHHDVHKVDCLANNFTSSEYTFDRGPLAGTSLAYRSSHETPFNQTNWPSLVEFERYLLNDNLTYNAHQVSVVVIDIRNVNGIPHYAYFSNGTWNRLGQNYSSTKVLAELAAIHKIRLASNFQLGAGVTVDGDSWSSLVRAIHYHSSNEIGEVFKQIAGLDTHSELNATTFVRGWLARPAELFNGGYGFGRRDTYFDFASSGLTLRLAVNRETVTANHLTPLAMAEFWKRLGVNRRDDRLMPKGNNLLDRPLHWKEPLNQVIDSYRRIGSGNHHANAYAPADIYSKRTTITLNDLYHIMYGGVNIAYNNRTHNNGMVWDGGVRDRFIDRNNFYAKAGAGAKFIAKTGSKIPHHSAFGGHVCMPKQGKEFAFFILGHGDDRTSSETVVQKTFDQIMNIFGNY